MNDRNRLESFFGPLNRRLSEAAETHRRRLEQFFLELKPRLDAARWLEAEMDRRFAPKFNVLDLVQPDELRLSGIIAGLLEPKGRHGQGALFLRCLLDKLQFDFDGDHEELRRSRVTIESTNEDQSRLDIKVEIGHRHCLAIENKPWAEDQTNQVRDYLKALEKYKSHLLIYLSGNGKGPSEDSLGKADRERLAEQLAGGQRRFAVVPYRAADLDDEFNEFRLGFSLVDWLAECRMKCDADKLSWFLRDVEDYCKHRFGGKPMTTAEHTAIKDFVLSDDSNWETALAVFNALPEIKREVCEPFLEKLQEKVLGRLRSDNLLVGARGDYAYKKGAAPYVCIYSGRWRPYSGGKRASICLCADYAGPNQWYISVRAPIYTSDMGDADKDRWKKIRKRLYDKLGRGDGQASNVSDMWYKGIQGEYRNWDPLIPAIYQELQQEEGGEIMRYFVEKFVEIAKVAVPIIDSLEVDPSS